MARLKITGPRGGSFGCLLAFVAIASGCTMVAPRKPADERAAQTQSSPASPPPSLHWARTAAEHHAAYVQAFVLATAEVRAAAKRHRRSWGVILDIDETVLDNSQFELERLRRNTPFNHQAFMEWCRREEAKATPGARDFLHEVHAFGGRAVLITNRPEEVCQVTRENLRKERLEFDEVLCSSGTDDKNPRFLAVENGEPPSKLPPLDIIMWIGDNIQDFPHLTQLEMRDASDDAFVEFGTRFIVLPNPMYGSWTSNPMR